DGGEVVEGVSEPGPRQHRAVAEAGVVRGDHAVEVGQGRDQVAEHLRAGREAVQEQYRRRVLWPGLAVEDVQVTDLDRPVEHFLLDHGISWGRVGGPWASADCVRAGRAMPARLSRATRTSSSLP